MATGQTADTAISVTTFTLHTTIVKTERVTAYASTGTTEVAASLKTSTLRTAPDTSSSIFPSPTLSQISDGRQPVSTSISIASTVSAPWTSTLASPPTVFGSSAGSASSSWTLFSLQSNAPLSTPSATSGNALSSARSTLSGQKHAIVGGLSGAIAGLVLIGVIVAFCLRRNIRKRPEYEDHESSTEKGFRPVLSRKWTELTGKGTPRELWQPAQAETPVTVDEDHHLIRMNTRHWPRPYAQGQGEGWRESQAPGTLRVVNPDESRPATPARMPSDTAESFLKKQRSAIVAVIASAGRSRANSQPTQQFASPKPVPSITVDPAPSRECVLSTDRAPSCKSYPSVRSSLVIMQQPPEDPFLTPPEATADPTVQQRPRRPDLAPVQHATSAATRTLSSFGGVLNAFRTRSNVTVRTSSTWSSRLSKRCTGQYSNPFDLWVHKPVPAPAHGRERDSGGRWTLYEGT
ncbi:hypothetical protein Tdes44962_MAKER06372 [Teratosphaeria destructans]|uniref:Mid2 domain-containing protein n=1 Tax=Teratosphaeria destructans TaxID=418781 RepID=A0A9W7SHX3_9PEZI|nr:hypothetical protein Tdes44962_MAKER06372 [Teratosphaeria destructans]